MDNMPPVFNHSVEGLEQEPPLCAHLITSRRGYNHHGVYAGRGRVIHCSGLSGFWRCGPVEEVPSCRFVNRHPVQIVVRCSPDLRRRLVRAPLRAKCQRIRPASMIRRGESCFDRPWPQLKCHWRGRSSRRRTPRPPRGPKQSARSCQ
jgi:hypothetical protein